MCFLATILQSILIRKKPLFKKKKLLFIFKTHLYFFFAGFGAGTDSLGVASFVAGPSNRASNWASSLTRSRGSFPSASAVKVALEQNENVIEITFRSLHSNSPRASEKSDTLAKSCIVCDGHLELRRQATFEFVAQSHTMQWGSHHLRKKERQVKIGKNGEKYLIGKIRVGTRCEKQL